jgi:hypothetical protein
VPKRPSKASSGCAVDHKLEATSKACWALETHANLVSGPSSPAMWQSERGRRGVCFA